MSATSWFRITACENIPPREGRAVTLGDRELAIFNVDGTFHALDNECPHRGGPLAEGEIEGCIVTCPWHAWQFDVTSGESITDDLKVERYDAKVEGDDVLVAIG